MSLDRIEPVRIVAPPAIERLQREPDRERDPGKKKQQQGEPNPQDEAADDGLPHIDIRA